MEMSFHLHVPATLPLGYIPQYPPGRRRLDDIKVGLKVMETRNIRATSRNITPVT
jgi:hypothetical protein